MSARRRPLGSYLRWAVILVVAVVLLSFLVLLTGIPGFGYRSPRRGDAGFEARGPEGEAPAVLTPRAAGVVAPLPEAKTSARLYYPRRDRPYAVAPVDAVLPAGDDLAELVRALVEALKAPPPGAGVLPALPAEARVLTVFLQDLGGQSRVLLNLSIEAQDPLPGGVASSHGTLYSLVNSLTSLPGVVAVKLLVSSQEALTFREHHGLEEDLRFNPAAIDDSPRLAGPAADAPGGVRALEAPLEGELPAGAAR